ncbi:hypothetical protein HFC70_14645 [Agrobacterium sp. a22-2]|uniref:HAMP domain-containing protein n=1 Tax=Agrobacterium sp. a22-2 TaxID=2283840 RepID=UPI001446D07A|nr:cache and HAMP domain-containing protein [Agrobacterium sp. a22-2]NKN37589.1 hypothetical protein [Agrobacterium sp. a22-2]
MARKKHRRTAPTLITVTFVFVAASAVVVGVLFFVLMRERFDSYQRDVMISAIGTRAEGVQTAFAHALFEQWSRLRHLSGVIGDHDAAAIAMTLDTIVGDGSQISWGGYANVDGTILAASGNLLVGADVSSRPWFQEGLEGPYAGDVHDAVLLAEKLGSSKDSLPRFLDLAMPVRDGNGEIRGVLGLHLNADWAASYIKDIADALDIDVYLVNENGTVVIASDDAHHGSLDIPSMRAARTGAAASYLERWPDGRMYFSATVPEVGYRELPSFGWSLVARIPAEAFLAPQENFSERMIFYLVSFGVMLILMTLIFIQFFIRPISTLSRNARKIADGIDVYPYEPTRTSELRALSGALARLQSRLHRHNQSGDRDPSG